MRKKLQKKKAAKMDLINRLIDIHKLVIEGKSDSSLMEERS